MIAPAGTHPTARSRAPVPPAPARTRATPFSDRRFRALVEDLFRPPYHARDERMAAVINAIRDSRSETECLNILADEAVCRGGLYGLDWAAHVLSRFPGTLGQAIDSYFRKDAPRRAADRKLPRPRYRVADAIWGLLLDGLARCRQSSLSTTAVLVTLRRVERSATDGMVEGLAAAAAALADRGPADRKRVRAFLGKLLARPDLSGTSRRAVEGFLSDLED